MVNGPNHPTQSRTPPDPPRRSRRRAAALLAAGGLALGFAFRSTKRVVVTGGSMLPTFEPGDRLVVVPALRLEVGDVVAARDPRQPERLLVKRVSRLGAGLVWLRGDNPTASTDSRDFGPLPRSAVAGRVVYRYAPPGRAGRTGRPRWDVSPSSIAPR